MADAVWDGHSGEGIAMASLLRGQVLRVRSIAVAPGSPGFGLAYEMMPVRGSRRSTGAPKRRGPRNQWRLEGRDDVGTEYEAPSGAWGPSPSGRGIRGVLDIYPCPPPDASWLDLTFHAGRARFVLRVNLPLRVLTSAEMADEHGLTEHQLQTMMDSARQAGRVARGIPTAGNWEWQAATWSESGQTDED